MVEKKADANYKTVSAASIAAKVARDEITANWVFSEEHYVPQNGKEWNSGYPSDPKCKEVKRAEGWSEATAKARCHLSLSHSW